MLIVQRHRKLYQRAGQNCGRSKGKKRQPPQRTGSAPSNAFLKHAFAPVISREVALLGQPWQIEREFFNSLSNLAALYRLDAPRPTGQDYPLNISQALELARKQLSQKRKELDLVILNDKTHKACVATAKTFDTGSCLYYIAVKPLQLLWDNPQSKTQANLLLSVFCYLHLVAGISYFTDGFLSGTYEMIKEWYAEDERANDEEDGCFSDVMQTYRAMNYYGGKMLKRISHPYHLRQLENRVARFKPVTQSDKELHNASTRMLHLYRQYPDRGVFDNIFQGLVDPQEEERVLPGQYLSFFWEGEGTVYEQLIESVNVSLQETGAADEPTALQFFDSPQAAEYHDLGFEEQLFDAIDYLADFLNDIK